MTEQTESRVAVSVPRGSELLPFHLPAPSSTPLLPAQRQVDIEAVQYICIRVADIRKAEAFYQGLFGMDILYRAHRTDNGWTFLPADFDWDAGIRQGVLPDYVLLRNGPLSLLLEFAGRGAVFVEPRLSHISLRVAPETLLDIRGEVLVRGYAVAEDLPHSFLFRDPFGVMWHLATSETGPGQ